MSEEWWQKIDLQRGISFADLRLEHLVTGDFSRCLERDLVRLRRGVFLPKDFFPVGLKPFEVHRFVSKARALSSIAVRRDVKQVMISGEAALLMRGYPTWWNSPNICVRTLNGVPKARRVLLPEIKVGDVACPSVVEYEITAARLTATSGVKAEGETEKVPKEQVNLRASNDSGIKVASVSESLADMVRSVHPAQSFVAACGIFNSHTKFNRFQPESGRTKESELRDYLVQLCQSLRGLPGYRSLLELAALADAGVESVGEGYILWLLRCMLDSRVILKTQFQVSVKGRTYYLDFAFPDRRVGWEFDGVGKMLSRNAGNDFLNRQNALLEAGWKIRRISIDQLLDTESLIHSMLQSLVADGIIARYPSGALWKNPTPDLLSFSRRF